MQIQLSSNLEAPDGPQENVPVQTRKHRMLPYLLYVHMADPEIKPLPYATDLYLLSSLRYSSLRSSRSYAAFLL